MVTATPSAHRDRGAVLVLTLILSVVLAAVGLALANYVMVGLRSADVASERTETPHRDPVTRKAT